MSRLIGVSKRRTEDKRCKYIKIARNFFNSNYLDNGESSSDPSVSDLYNGSGDISVAIEDNPAKIFEHIKEDSLQTTLLLSQLFVTLSGRAIDVICNHVFKKSDAVNDIIIQMFYASFFKVFLTRPYTWFSLHILVRASKAHPTHFKNTWKSLLQDKDISSTILEDFVAHISATDCTNYMKLCVETEFTAEQFAHISPVIYILYKKSDKTDSVFSFVQNQLISFSDYCAHNRGFGKLMLCFVQTISGRDIIFRYVKEMVDRHCTLYKNLCLAELDRYVTDVIAQQADIMDDGHRIIIPRHLDRLQL